MNKWIKSDWIETKVSGDGIEDYPIKKREISDKEKKNFSITYDTASDKYPKLLIQKLCKGINQVLNKEIAYETWYDKNRKFPYINFGSWGIPPSKEEKSVFVDVCFWADKESMDILVNETFWFLKSLAHSDEITSIKIQSPHTAPVEPFIARMGIFKVVIETEFVVKYSLTIEDEQRIISEKEKFELLEICRNITGSFATSIKVSPTGQYMVCYKYGDEEAYLIENERKELWHKKLGGINDVAISPKEDYVVFATYLTNKEMGGDFKIGGHAYCFNINGNKISDFKTDAVAESCAISLDGSFYVIGTIKPDNSVYYFDRLGNLIWKKKVGKVVLHLEISKENKIFVYAGVSKVNKDKLCVLTSDGNIIE